MGTGGSASSVADTPGGAIANSMFRVEVTYTNRAGSTHVEQPEINVKNKTETPLDDLKVETTADAGRAVETLDKVLKRFQLPRQTSASQNRLNTISITHPKVRC